MMIRDKMPRFQVNFHTVVDVNPSKDAWMGRESVYPVLRSCGATFLGQEDGMNQ